MPFKTPDEAVAGVEEINRRYDFPLPAQPGRLLEEYFDARKTLPALDSTRHGCFGSADTRN